MLLQQQQLLSPNTHLDNSNNIDSGDAAVDIGGSIDAADDSASWTLKAEPSSPLQHNLPPLPPSHLHDAASFLPLPPPPHHALSQSAAAVVSSSAAASHFFFPPPPMGYETTTSLPHPHHHSSHHHHHPLQQHHPQYHLAPPPPLHHLQHHHHHHPTSDLFHLPIIDC
jgi:hypothetical protein